GKGERPKDVKEVNWIGDRFVIFRNNKTGSGMLGADFEKQCEDLDDFYASINKGRGIKLADIKYDVYYDQEGGKQREQLWKDLYNLLSITKSFNGIRHVLADQAEDKERQSVPETFISNS
ncbi:25872_t:CDS:2, partial [Racocetra persica]